MSRETVVYLVDDLTGERLPDGGGETVTFSLDGTSWEMDLSHEHAAELRAFMRRYMDKARRVGLGHPHTRRNVRGPAQRGQTETSVVRAWAVKQGLLAQGSRGRIPATIREQYDLATRAGNGKVSVNPAFSAVA
jgi:hypothetical protein